MTTTRSDCGCTDTTSAAAWTAKTTSSSSTKPTRTGAPAPAAEAPTSATVALGGFTAFNPVDGLFLRAEHLKAIQDYARSLTRALATAGGAGVVHGLGVTLTDGSLEVSPGLAITRHGQLLLLASTVKVRLDSNHVPPRPTNGFWRVELHWASANSGSAPVYGSLCNDGCADGGGAVIQPWREEGVKILLATDSLPGLDAVSLERRTNWLASAYFERERAAGQPWLVPAAAGSPVDELRSRDWEDATSLPGEQGVPLALVQNVDGTYRLDVWAARRLADGPLASASWRSRLAIRPWSVFLAQILQFEAELTAFGAQDEPLIDVSAAYYYRSTATGLLDEAQRFIEGLNEKDPVRNRKAFQRLEEVVETAATDPIANAGPTPLSTQSGLGELPPAGYLQVDHTREDLEVGLAAFFGDHADVRFRRLRADQVPDEVVAAQSRDRIPLDPVPGISPQVDVLIPTEPADKEELYTAAYDWVAFVRRGPEVKPQAPPPPETEQVKVYLFFFGEEGERFAHDFTEADLESAQQNDLGTLTYPKASWAYPGGEVARKTLEAVQGSHPIALVAITRGDDTPLASTRAGLFGTSLDSGHPLPVYAYPQRPVDAIVVIAPIVLK